MYLRKEVAENGDELSEVMYKCTECGKETKFRANCLNHIKTCHMASSARISVKKLRRLVMSGNCVITPDEDNHMFSG